MFYSFFRYFLIIIRYKKIGDQNEFVIIICKSLNIERMRPFSSCSKIFICRLYELKISRVSRLKKFWACYEQDCNMLEDTWRLQSILYQCSHEGVNFVTLQTFSNFTKTRGIFKVQNLPCLYWCVIDYVFSTLHFARSLWSSFWYLNFLKKYILRGLHGISRRIKASCIFKINKNMKNLDKHQQSCNFRYKLNKILWISTLFNCYNRNILFAYKKI